MLNAISLKLIIESGEGFNVDFKLNVPSKVREITEEVCSFANAGGGFVLIGVDNRNKICGTTINNSKRSAIQDSLGEISPKIHCEFYPVEIEDKTVWIIEVPSGDNKPYIFSGVLYMREGANSQKLTTAAEIHEFFKNSGKLFFDDILCPSFNLEKDADSSFIKEFRQLAGIHGEISDRQIFENLMLCDKNGCFKNGAVLFFAKQPSDFIFSASIRCVLYQGTNKLYIEDDKTMEGPVYLQYLQALNWLKIRLKVGYDIEGQGGKPRVEVWEIPEVVFKESLINALAHRDYYDKGGTIIVEVFTDRVDISNPGALVSSISPEDFGKLSRSRNPMLFNLFQRIHMVEKVGSGVVRMRNSMQDANLKSPEFLLKGSFIVSFTRPQTRISTKKENKPELLSLTENQKAILNLINENESITISELSDLLHLTTTAIEKNINKLKKTGHLQRTGSKKNGRWTT